MKIDWKRLEDAYAAQAEREILKLMRGNPAHALYAVALHGSYRELDGEICLPCLAANSIETLRDQQGCDEVEYDFGPPNWDWCGIILETKELNRLATALQDEATRSTQNHWYKTEKRFISTMVRVTKRLYAILKERKQTTSDFVVFFDDEQGDLDLIRKCIPKSLFLKHFPDQDLEEKRRRKLTASPISKKLKTYLSDMWEFQAEVVQLGEGAVDGLIANLKSSEDGWMAASLLGQIGVSSDKVIRALRREVRRSSAAAMQSASALGVLGDTKYLLKLTDDDVTRENAISGLTAPYQAGECVKPIPLDYRLLERLVEKKCSKCTRMVKKELAPGTSYCDIAVSDIDEAIRGLQSPHLVIRQHAVCVLGERSLGKTAAKRILPALAEKLRDRHANVRRLAIWNISYWKSAAKPYRLEIRKLIKDSDPDVRSTARHVLS
jgi:hypothetical protein